ncbi:gliding motility-associated C-terminal domain-containing protein [Flavobacterium poyangense]|uniref:gliding motility-associated C-terminal domain-containing protein n=1 Tax=Flavobacterium poyangense TaxID=2204302 RepID=UPI0014237308|nr:gliding motility-associated C-terminal domain-containing protein [Flavobacterium sp. JXAS1]
MKFKKQNILGTLLLFGSGIVAAQTVNVGDLYITSGTIMSTVGAMDNQSSGNLFNDGEFYLYSHYNNDGLVTFSPGTQTGITRMNGITGAQQISGTLPMQWNHVEFKNGTIQPAFHLSNEVTINGTADFQNGIIDNDNFGGLLVFESGSKAVNVSDNSHADGKVKKNGKEDFIYPIGDQNKYRFAGISAPTEVLSSFTGKYFYENSDALYSHSQKAAEIKLINNQEYWTLDKTGGSSDVMLTLSWDETSTTPADVLVSPQSSIHIVRWDDKQQLWIDEGGVVDSNRKTVTTPVNVAGYGVFTTARVDDGIVLACTTLTVYNAVSPNGDDKNDYFKIDGLTECSADNTVEIYNRWGVKVFETSNYDSKGNVFRGYSEGRVTVSKDKMLPSGTYFYILNFKYPGTKTQTVKKSGYLYLSRD